MKIVYIISNFIYSAFSLLGLSVLYVDYFGPGLLPEFLLTVLGKVADSFFSERNMIVHLLICIVCILFAIMTVVLFIKNLIQKQNVASFVLSAISIISMIGFIVLIFYLNNLSLDSLTKWLIFTKWFILFNTVMIIVQIIAAVINTVKSYSIEYSE